MDIKKIKRPTVFGEIDYGMVFEYEDEIYMKVDQLYADSDMPNVVALGSGLTYVFADDLEVVVREATLTVKE